MTELHHRLEELRSFILWTAPLYLVFVGVGLYETHLTVTLAFVGLLVVLAAFGVLDGLVLMTLQGLGAQLAGPAADLPRTRARLERLSRTILVGGAALGAAGVCGVVILSLG